MYWIGIDLGTSAMKLLLVAESGEIVRSAERSYPLLLPHPARADAITAVIKTAMIFFFIPTSAFPFSSIIYVRPK